MSRLRAFILGAAIVVTLGAGPLVGAQTQGPIHVLFDMHVDPWPNNLSLAQKQTISQAWIANMNWVLDQTEPLGVKISFLSGGPWMELLVAGGSSGPGAALLRRIYQNGAQVGAHNHVEYRAGANDWPGLPGTATLAQIQQAWQDNVDWVNSGILTAFSNTPPESLNLINSVRGSHLPSNEPDYHALMQFFAIPVREGGAEEDYYQWYGHHIWQPFRPSATNYMDEDPATNFVVCPQGSVIGLAQVHHGIFQDMTVPQVKRQFLQLYLNWRHRDRHGLPEKVWCWGWGSHASDFDPADPSRSAIQDVLPWIDQRFAQRVEPSGSQVMTWDTQRNTAAVYRTWETAHPGQSSWDFDAQGVDWNEYPYLRPVAEELEGFGWTADLAIGPGIDAYALQNGTTRAVLVWCDSGTSTVDVSGWVGPSVRIIGLETGLTYADSTSAVFVGQEPVLVTERGACSGCSTFCFGDGTGAACPCGNNGGAGNGCANSSNVLGAQLVASGTTNPDTIVLAGAGMPATVSAIYLKGDQGLATGVVFGDGVRCVDGALVRLRTKQNVAGASQFPDSTDTLTVSGRGGTPSGSGLVGYYQTYYRNAAAAFCPPATFNVTNGVLIVW